MTLLILTGYLKLEMDLPTMQGQMHLPFYKTVIQVLALLRLLLRSLFRAWWETKSLCGAMQTPAIMDWECNRLRYKCIQTVHSPIYHLEMGGVMFLRKE